MITNLFYVFIVWLCYVQVYEKELSHGNHLHQKCCIIGTIIYL